MLEDAVGTGRSSRGCPIALLGCIADHLCFPPAVSVASSEQNPVLIIVVVAIAGMTVLVSMVIGTMVWRR